MAARNYKLVFRMRDATEWQDTGYDPLPVKRARVRYQDLLLGPYFRRGPTGFPNAPDVAWDEIVTELRPVR